VVTADPPQRIQRFGPETWEEIAGRDWSLWDLWFCVVATLDHDGDLDALTDTFVGALRSHGNHDRGVNEAKLSHLTDLRARLRDANLVAADLARPDLLADQKITRRAREKVTGRISLEGRACTPAMVDTPRRLLQQRARVGHWSSFPSDPARFFERFRPAVDRKGFVTKGKSFAIASRLTRRLADLDGPRRTLPIGSLSTGRSTRPASSWPTPPTTATASLGRLAPRRGSPTSTSTGAPPASIRTRIGRTSASCWSGSRTPSTTGTRRHGSPRLDVATST
jgi:hypothetical protein